MSKKIITIDDEPDVLVQVGFILKKSGYQVMAAESGDAGWELIRKEKPDLVLLDLLLPGINGIEISRRIKADEELKNIPVILLTASADDINTKMRAASADDYLLKPFEYQELLKKIEAHL